MNQAAELLSQARTRLICNHPFFGALALRLKLVAAPEVSTASVNSHTIRYNPAFIQNLTTRQRETLLAHEVMHNVLEHGVRLLGRQRGRWNVACDYAINWILQEADFDPLPRWCCDAQYANKIADEIYTELPPDHDDQAIDDIEPPDPAAAQNTSTWKIAAVQAAQVAKSLGNLPGSIQRLVNELTAPKVDWRECLHRFANGRARDDFSWVRPNRKALASGLYLPGLFSRTADLLAVAVDTSGSVGPTELQAFGAEIAAIHQSLKPRQLRVIYCDTAVRREDVFEPHDTVAISQAPGGGGTSFVPPFRHLAEQGIVPECLVYLTDLYGPFPESADFPVLWCATTDRIAPFGETVRIEV